MSYRPIRASELQASCNFVLWLADGEPDCGERATEVDDDPRLSRPKYRCQRHSGIKPIATEETP